MRLHSDEDGNRHRHRHGREGSGAAPTALERRIEELERVRFCASSSFSHRSRCKRHTWRDLFGLVAFPHTGRVEFLPFARGKNMKSSDFRRLSAIFWPKLNDRCRFRASLGAVLTFLRKTSPSAQGQTPRLSVWNVSILPNLEVTQTDCHIVILNFILAWGGYPNPVSPELV